MSAKRGSVEMQHLFILKVSNIPAAGVGCFAATPVPSGRPISSGHRERFRLLAQEDIPDEYLKYCVLLPAGRYLSPRAFMRMGVFWYVNHARHPNTEFRGGRLWALGDIAAGDELTLYYSDLLVHPKNRLWVSSGDIDASRSDHERTASAPGHPVAGAAAHDDGSDGL